MTIKAFMDEAREAAKRFVPQEKDLPSYDKLVEETTDIWSNYACMGYIIYAMQNVGFDDDDIRKVLGGLYHAFDDLTVEEAERQFKDF